MNQPNIVLFVGEDTGRHQTCYGDPFARTPHIDRLAREGCRYTNAFTSSPVCAPSRSALITGQFATKIGSHQMRSTLLNPPVTFTEQLRRGGYHVNWANKTDFNFEPPDSFADDRSDWIAALEAGDAPRKPFLLYYNFADTHESRLWPPGANPQTDNPAPEPCHPDGLSAAELQGIPVPPYLPDTLETRCALLRYYQRLAEQDAMVGRIRAALEKNNLLDNTIFIYMSDHGRGLNREKRWLYDAGIHLPLIIRAPWLIKPGSISEELVAWVDIAPTLHALAGIDIPDRYDGRVFLSPDAQPEPDYVFAARDRIGTNFDRSRAARDRRYLYIRNDFPDLPWAQRCWYYETSPVTYRIREMHAAGELRFPENIWMQPQKPPEELYDTAADPHCLHNLAEHADYAETLAAMRAAVHDWSKRIGDIGFTSEKQLIASGVIKDQLASFAAHIEPLPEHQRAGGKYDAVLLEPGT